MASTHVMQKVMASAHVINEVMASTHVINDWDENLMDMIGQ